MLGLIENKMKTLILTARIDAQSQAFFDELRAKYFPKERNFLRAHLTLFHKLPDSSEVLNILEALNMRPIQATVSSLKNIGQGVAYFLATPALSELQLTLKKTFHNFLIPQDQQSFRPHITIQNKVKPEEAVALLQKLQTSFTPFDIHINGLDLWHYLDGPWQHYRFFEFSQANEIR